MADKKNIVYKIHVDAKTGTATVRKLNGTIVKGAVDVNKLNKEFGDLGKTINAQKFNKWSKSLKSATNSTASLKNASGSATSSVLEMGRVIQDSNYGIRGMANNITQLASQLVFMRDKAGSSVGALKAFKNALFSPTGFLLVISAVVAIMEKMSTEASKLSKSLSIFKSVVSDNTAKLLSLETILSRSKVSMEDKSEAVRKANQDFKGLNIELDNNGRLTKNSKNRLDELTNSLIKNAKAQALVSAISKARSKIVELEEERLKKAEEEIGDGEGFFKQRLSEDENRLEAAKKLFKEYSDRYSNSLKAQGVSQQEHDRLLADYQKRDTAGRLNRIINRNEKEIKLEEKKVDRFISMIESKDLTANIFGGKDTNTKLDKISPFKTPEDLELDVKDNEDAIEKLALKTDLQNLKNEEKAKLSEANTQEEKDNIINEYASKRLEKQLEFENELNDRKRDREKKAAEDKYNDYLKELDDDLKAYEKNLRDKGIAEEKINKLLGTAGGESKEKREAAKAEYEKTVQDIEDAYEALFPFWAKLADARRNAIGISGEGGGEPEEDGVSDLDRLQASLQAMATLTSEFTNFLSGEYERELTIEQNKTNALNNELNERLLNESLSKDQRKAIQMQIAQNDEKLRKKQEQIAKKKFEMEKKANIAGAIINTASAAVGVLNDTKGDMFMRIAAMTAVIGAGLAQVATIARQKFQSSAGSSPIRGVNGGGQEGGGREFDFNLVGSSGVNQLSGAIGSQLDRPIKTYVVSKEISTQQELDLSIQGSAKLGG